MKASLKESFCKIEKFLPLVVLLVGILLYIVPLKSTEFYYDDIRSIQQNDIIRKMDIPTIFDSFNTRTLVGLSFALNYKLAGLNPMGYRLVNLLIHCLNTILVYFLLKNILAGWLNRKSKVFVHVQVASLFAAFIFLCHPIQTEPVNFITQRFVLLGTLFYLLTITFYVKYRSQSKRGYLFLSIFFATLAMFCKEFVVTLPIMLSLYEFYFLGEKNEGMWVRLRRLIPFFVVILIIPFLLLRTPSDASIVANIADTKVINEGGQQKKVIDITRAHYGLSREKYFLTELNVICTYMRLLFVPVNQNLDYDYPLVLKLNTKTVICGLFLLGLFILAIRMYKKRRILSFGILWFFIALSVESSFIPIGHVIAEYRVYLASVGFAILIAVFIYSRNMDVKKLNFLTAVILLILGILTYQRNLVWKNESSLWEDIVAKSPNKSRPHNNLALSYDLKGDYVNALKEYQKAVELYPNDAQTYYNMGVVYGKMQNINQALVEYNKAIQVDPNYADAYCNRGTIYSSFGKFSQAITDYSKAIVLTPKRAVLYINRGNSYNLNGNLERAIEDYNKVIELDPNYAAAYDNLAVTYYQLKRYDQALEYLSKLEKFTGYMPERVNLLKKLLQVRK
ncbi:MAG: tetratricopeptide repeat protein [Candidatus Omnitrophica bacterium]|nr:tetratricopeptide repeat protein [Candidatus Omnitrophota bacterium]